MKYLTLVSLIVLTLFSCKEEDDGTTEMPDLRPVLSLADAEVNETDEDFDFNLTLMLDRPAASNVVLNYATSDGSASGASDFERVENAEVIIPAGVTEFNISVRIKGDEAEEPTETFQVLLLNPINATLDNSSATISILDDDDPSGNGLNIPTSGYVSADSYEGMSMVWEENFNGNTIDESMWNFEIGTGNNGWGNSELQYYRKENASIAESEYLVIEARNEQFGGSDYTSTRMTTQDKKEFQYGRIDIRAALPEGKGLWPALWMLGENFQSTGWPMCGEIDIMELVGNDPGRVHGTVHFGDSFANHQFVGGSTALSGGAKFSEEFHVFSIDWVEDRINFLVDDEVYKTITPATTGDQPYPFNQPFFFIVNVAVGGQWPGSPDNTTSFPQRMIVDYIRVFQ